jgi:predicted phosphodiesterase
MIGMLIKGISEIMSPVYAPVFLLIASMVILSTTTEAIAIGNHPIYTSFSSPAALPDFNFAAVGDFGCNANTNNTINNIIDKKPELVLALGDFSYEPTADCWFQSVHPIIDKMKIVIGNHDDRIGGLGHVYPGMLSQYMNAFGLQKQYYSFNYQNVHLLALSTEVLINSSSEQYEFVKSDLSKTASDPNIDWIIVYIHKPMYTLNSTHIGNSTLRNTYHPLFDQYGVDLVLQGHNHNYERTYPIKFNATNPLLPIKTSTNTSTYTDPEGDIYITVGTGGARLDPFKANQRYEKSYHIIGFERYGILNIDITNGGKILTGKFYTNNGPIIDTFTITK